MKFIFVCSSFSIGGVETSFSTLVDGAIGKTDKVELHLVDQSLEIKTYIPERVKIRYVYSNYNDIYGFGTLKGAKFLYNKYGLWSAIKRVLVKILLKLKISKPFILSKEFFDIREKSECDVCVILKENDPCIFYAINNVESRKRIAFFHTANYLKDDYKCIYCSKLINEIITVSQGNKDFLIENMPSVAQKIHVVHNIVPVERIKAMAIKNLTTYNEDEFSVLYVGRICKEKGVDQIIDSAILLRDELPNIQWYLLGPYDKELSPTEFETMIANKGIQDKVSVLSPVDNPYPYIAHSKIIVNPSRIESFGMVIREAQILGKPVVATKTYGGIELIEDEKTGILVDIDNPEQLVDAIKKLVLNTDYYEEIVKNLKNTDYDETKIVQKQFYALLK